MKRTGSAILCGLALSWTYSLGSPTEEGRLYHPTKYACPVTANLFPEQEASADTLRFTFSENAGDFSTAQKFEIMKRAARRISIALMNPEGTTVKIGFTWTGMKFFNSDGGVWLGTFIVKADGSPNCFFLGAQAGLPNNVPCREFLLKIPPGVKVLAIAFSSLGGEFSKNCPMPELEKEINKAYQESLQDPQDETKATLVLSLLERAIPKYDCLPEGGGFPVPAWQLADWKSIDNWILLLNEKVTEDNDFALRVYCHFMSTAEGIWAQEMVDTTWKTVHDRPMFILRNWESIREFRESLLGSVFFNPPGSGIELINIYQEIARENPEYKTACEEIIKTTRDLIKRIRRE